ncbi:probable lipid phosphate phosphatase beta [Ricinus communis]|uniref:Sphingosine-1-phosphate phosphohydrolase, putative n=1 Tax=Ricinus communis TaxID=3988 RepID=B9SUW9_RICCO|nr:probable lipid phosphate phosphatase beta [Ricinus communis]EEF32594.1 sphingosine-1-phosphate phosphohydrolase, putative [Ricinus communis]|eukprot:XP_002529780.1 probable lipid phosphate phosphatase beta isoform X2 [Ricinus communis]
MATQQQEQQRRRPLLCHLINLDTKFSLFLHSVFSSCLPSSIFLLLELSADFRFSFPITLSLFLSPLSPPFLHFLSPLLLGLLLDLALVGLIKVTFRRSRPPYNPNMSPAVSADNFSFPSGHASRVFFIASLVSLSQTLFETALLELRVRGGGWFIEKWVVGDESKVIEIVVFVVSIWAAITALSRVLLGRHFFLDVLAGACLGLFEGFIAFRFLRFEKFLSLLLNQRVGQGKS